MIINFLLSLISICAATVLSIKTSGGTITGLFNLISFTGVLLLFVVALFISGYGKTFCRIFSTRKNYQSMELQELKNTDLALKYASKILFYTAILVPVLVLIYTLRNYYKDAETYSHLGPNCAVLLSNILYLSLFEMIIYTLKAKVHKSVIQYMAENEEKTAEKFNGKTLVKMIARIAFFILIAVLYSYISGIYAWGKYTPISSFIDIPLIIIMIVYVLPLVMISGNIGTLFRSIKIIFTGIKIGVSDKALYLNAIKTTMALNWYGAFSAAACGWIGMLRNLEDASALAPNLSVSLIPFLYACCFNLFLLFAEIRITKAAE